MSSAADLARSKAPWLMSLPVLPPRAYELAWRLAGEGAVARVVRGHKMRTAAALFDEFGGALQFPDYFGENWAALDECLTDLSWLPGERYVLVITSALEVLGDEADELLSLFHDVLVRAATTWAQPVTLGESWDRPAIPFHVLVQVDPGDQEAMQKRWGVLAEFAE